MKTNKEIIKEDIAMLKGLKIQFIKKGQFKIAQEIEEELKIMEDKKKGRR